MNNDKEISNDIQTITKNIEITKPLIKWVGGKTQIIDKIMTKFPTKMNNYHEIFVGGGSVLLGLLTFIEQKIISVNGNIYAYDYNDALIHVYKNIQLTHEALYIELQGYIAEYNLCPPSSSSSPIIVKPRKKIDSSNPEPVIIKDRLNRKPKNSAEAKMCKENYYYWIRMQYNKLSQNDKRTVTGSAMFIFLNKTCFRGIFRLGPNGYNVPYGNYDNPEIINKNHLDEINRMIKNVIFQTMDYSVSIKNILDSNNNKEDFVYLDPPYAPENSKSFVNYNENGFEMEKHMELFRLCNQLNINKIKFMMSNADVELVRNNFISETYKITSLMCKRAINSKKPESKSKEIILTNY
jgi:DNA adenine methylase